MKPKDLKISIYSVYTMEKVIRKVTEIGNGAHVFAPKEWLNEEIILTRIPKKSPKEEILKVISPYMEKVTAVFLFGSYARNEADNDSDMDFFVISDEKFSIKEKNMEIIVIPEDKIETAKKLNPVLFYSMLQEAKPIINSSYLKKLKEERVNFSYFKDFLKDTENSIISNKKIIDMDIKLKQNNASESVIYSLILRLRGIFIVNMILNKKLYSKKMFRDWIVKNSQVDYEKVYNIYQAVRNDKKPFESVQLNQAESLLGLLIREIENLKKKW